MSESAQPSSEGILTSAPYRDSTCQTLLALQLLDRNHGLLVPVWHWDDEYCGDAYLSASDYATVYGIVSYHLRGLTVDNWERATPGQRCAYMSEALKRRGTGTPPDSCESGGTLVGPTVAGTSARSENPPTGDEAANSLRRSGECWEVRFGAESVRFNDRKGSAFRHLARLLEQPDRNIPAMEFYPPAAGDAPPPELGADDRTDATGVAEYRQKLVRLSQEIKEAEDARDTETATRLRDEFEQLSRHLGSDLKPGRRRNKLGKPTSAQRNAAQNVRVGMGRLYKRLRKNGLPTLADHLETHIYCENAEWRYTLPAGTSPWQVKK